MSERWREKLLEEGNRVEAAMPLQGVVSNTGLLLKMRRGAAGVIARAAYFGWRRAFA